MRVHRRSIMPSRRSAKGFTLIELLVVVAIIALLLTILLPSLQQARGMARRTACVSGQRQIGTALQMYADDNFDYFPMPNWFQYKMWDASLSPYLQYTTRYHPTYANNNPDMNIKSAFADDMPDMEAEYAVLRCPSDSYTIAQAPLASIASYETVALRRSYVIVCYPDNYGYPDERPMPGSPHYQVPIRREWSARPSYNFLIGEWWDPINMVGYNLCNDMIWSDYVVGISGRTLSDPKFTTAPGLYHGNEGANFVYMDGHAEFQRGEFRQINWWLDNTSTQNMPAQWD